MDEDSTFLKTLTYREFMLGYAFSFVKNWSAAETIVNETLIILEESTNSEGVEFFLTRFKAIIREKCISYQNKSGVNEESTQLNEEIENCWDSATVESLAQEITQLRHCIEKLRPKQQELLFKLYATDLSFAQIAAAHHSDIQFLRNEALYLRRRLRACLAASQSEDKESLHDDHDELFDTHFRHHSNNSRATELLKILQNDKQTHLELARYLSEFTAIAIVIKQQLATLNLDDLQRFQNGVRHSAQNTETNSVQSSDQPKQNTWNHNRYKYAGLLALIFFVILLITLPFFHKSDSEPSISESKEWHQAPQVQREAPNLFISDKGVVPTSKNAEKRTEATTSKNVYKPSDFELPMPDSTHHIESQTPVYQYSFDGHAQDSVGKQEAFLISPLQHVKGISGQAYAFSDFFHSIQPPNDKLNLKQGTISLWFLAQKHLAESAYLFSHSTKPGGGKGRKSRIEIYLSKQALNIGLGDNHYCFKEFYKIELSVWYNILLTWDNGKCHAYVNGNNQVTGQYNNLNLKCGIYIGNQSKGFNNFRRFIGIIDEVSIWNRPLSSDEAKEEYRKFAKE